MYSSAPVTTGGWWGNEVQQGFLLQVICCHCTCSDGDDFVNSALLPLILLFLLCVCLNLVQDKEGGHSAIYYLALEASWILTMLWKNPEKMHCIRTIGPGQLCIEHNSTFILALFLFCLIKCSNMSVPGNVFHVPPKDIGRFPFKN